MSDAKTISNGPLTILRRLGKLSLALALLAPAAACDNDPFDPNYSEDFQARYAPAGFPCEQDSDCEFDLICDEDPDPSGVEDTDEDTKTDTKTGTKTDTQTGTKKDGDGNKPKSGSLQCIEPE